MNQRYILFQRAGVYYCEDRQTGKQSSLRTRDKAEAITLLHARNETARQPILNLQMARVYLSAADPQMATRTWQMVMDEIIRTKSGANQDRWKTPNPPTIPWDSASADCDLSAPTSLDFILLKHRRLPTW